ncbi:RagB/SusD family nutrient uptake outer membrane protein [Flavobacterium limi]|uniref:Membrane protein n=1 Tax=Flavobacterium limi TaxID=2045105 RepID=A0ABQ1TQI1_9FLAO|nr:RagB/SusD family nutrient uptake outer membrane protein [Flavobacterium limi]GGE99140.1 membrane protein [Flavobacterium limi]
MKKLLYKISLFAGLAIMLVSCADDFLDKPVYGVLAADDYFKTEEELQEGVFACYDVLQWAYTTDWNSMYVVKSFPADETHAGGGSDGDQPSYQQLDDFSYTAENKPIEHSFKTMYFGIMRANAIINIAQGDSPAKIQMIAEAKALRAFFYFELVSMWGGVPLRLALPGASEFALEKSTPEQIYAQIHKDLDEAIPNLPKKSEYPVAMRFRMSKGTAQAIKGKAYLYQKMYPEAADAFDDVITSTEYDLAPDYSKLFLKESEYGLESLFEVGYNITGYDWGNFQWGGNRSMENNINWQLMGPRGDYYTTGTSGLLPGWGFNYPTAKMAQAFDAEGDVIRKNASILSVADLRTKYGGDWIVDKDLDWTEAPPVWGMEGYFRLKYGSLKSETVASPGVAELNYGTNIRLIRFADVLLMAAEANLLAGNTTDAQKYFTKVRDRVDLPVKTVTLDAIKTERRLELAFEGFRFLDLIRWGDAATVLKNQGFKKNGNFVDKHSLYPIPSAEILNNSKMTPNPGWGS